MRKQPLSLRALSAGMLGLLLALIPAARAQDYSADKSLGDAAREQAEIRRQNPVEPKHFAETGTAISRATSGTSETAKQSPQPEPNASSSTKSVPPERASATQTTLPARSLLDRPKDADDEDDSLVVPAGTQISVEVAAKVEFPALSYEGKVTVPVRVGFATAIPALSPAGVEVLARHYPYQDQGKGFPAYAYFEAVELTHVTVDGAIYAVHSQRVAKFGTNPAEVTFTLTEPLKIHR